MVNVVCKLVRNNYLKTLFFFEKMTKTKKNSNKVTNEKKNQIKIHYINVTFYQALYRGCPRGIMVKAMDCGIVVSEFVLQSRYYVHFRANTLGKGMNPHILQTMS